MGPGYFVIAILGCADGGSSCTPVTTLQTRYETEQQCSAATGPALANNNNFDFPTLVASCRPGAPRASAQKARLRVIPAGMRRD
jgi:acyl-CoA synthetase (AMP-forming)/AMP-acid ligase II